MVNLMKTKNVLFIVEGTNDEPHFIKQLLSKCYPLYNYKIYSYEANLHMLVSRFEKDYADFEDDELDILLFLKSYEESNKEIFNLKYTDVFMILNRSILISILIPFKNIQHHFYYHFNNTLQSTLLCFFMPIRQERKTK